MISVPSHYIPIYVQSKIHWQVGKLVLIDHRSAPSLCIIAKQKQYLCFLYCVSEMIIHSPLGIIMYISQVGGALIGAFLLLHSSFLYRVTGMGCYCLCYQVIQCFVFENPAAQRIFEKRTQHFLRSAIGIGRSPLPFMLPAPSLVYVASISILANEIFLFKRFNGFHFVPVMTLST